MRQVLQRAHLVLGQRALAADVDDRALRPEGVGDARDGIGAAGTGGGDDAAGLAGLARVAVGGMRRRLLRSEEHTSELQSLMRISYAVFCLKKQKYQQT